MGLVTLLLNSGPKLAVGKCIVWWSGLPWGSSSGEKLCILSYHSCHIYRTWKRISLRGGILKLSNGRQATKGWDHFYGESWALKTPCKDFNLATVGGLVWMKWLKNGAGKCLYFMQLFLHCILFGEIFVGSVKVPLYSVCLNLNHEKTK